MFSCVHSVIFTMINCTKEGYDFAFVGLFVSRIAQKRILMKFLDGSDI